jgi:hypothetical protein
MHDLRSMVRLVAVQLLFVHSTPFVADLLQGDILRVRRSTSDGMASMLIPRTWSKRRFAVILKGVMVSADQPYRRDALILCTELVCCKSLWTGSAKFYMSFSFDAIQPLRKRIY